VAGAGPYLPPLPVADTQRRGTQGAADSGRGGAHSAGGARSAGAHSARKSGRVTLAACVALAVVAIGVLGGFAVAHLMRSSPGSRGRNQSGTSHSTTPGGTVPTSLPAGYDWYSLPAASAGTAAGFRLAVPTGWDVSRSGLVTYVRNPSGAGFMEVDLTPHTFAGNMAEARWLQARTLAQGKFPGYHHIALRPAVVAGSSGAVWVFSWLEAGVGRVIAQDYLFTLPAGGATQSYAVYASAPASSWPQTSQVLNEAIQTFQPLT
jgi:hypothetical protein